MSKEEIKAVFKGKQRIKYGCQIINTSLYMDEKGQFCMIKGKRVTMV